VAANRVYSNAVGVQLSSFYSGRVVNNLIYANSAQGILADGAGSGSSGPLLINNTVYQPVGDAVRVQGRASSVTLHNNLLDVQAGYDVYVTDDSHTGFNSDYNLLHKGLDPNAHVGFWNGTTQDGLTDWQTATTQDAHSGNADPQFIDIAGADHVLGFAQVNGVFQDGGADDNFALAAGSPAIDRCDSAFAPATDFLGVSRVDDPGTPNQGSPDYFPMIQASSLFAATGVAQRWQSTGAAFNLALPFAFPFYNGSFTSVWVSTEGFVQFGDVNGVGDRANSVDGLSAHMRIAPLWGNLTTSNAAGTDDIFVDTSVAGQVAVRWKATNLADNSDVNFAVVLFQDGRVRFDYGDGNTNLTPTVGLSAGTGLAYHLTPYDGRATLTNVHSILFDVQPGIADLGALEFAGSSLDTTTTTITGTTPTTIDASGSTHDLVQTLQVSFSRALNPIDANAPAVYELRKAGSSGFGSPDDVVYALTPHYTPGGTQVTLDVGGLPSGALPIGDYRFTIFSNSTTSIHDVDGMELDGDRNGTAGGDYMRTFHVLNPIVPVVPQGGFTLNAVEGLASAVQTVATFTDPTGRDALANYAADIDWGDGTTSAGTITLDAGSGVFTVAGSHTYAEEGPATVMVTVHHDGDASATSSAAVTDAELTPGSTTFAATVGVGFTETVANFTDADPNGTASDYTATIDWGDSTTSIGILAANAGGFAVTGTHTYTGAGSFPVAVTLTDAGGGSAQAAGTATVTVAPVVATGSFTLTAAEAVNASTQTVATFTDAGPSRPLTDYSATIDWGDSSSSAGVISLSGGVFTVSGSHDYAEEGSFLIGVAISRGGNLAATAISQAAVSDPAVTTAGGFTLSATEGSASGIQTLATFTDPAGAEDSSGYTATVDWGDSSSASGTVSLQAGVFTVTGSHTYANQGSYAVRVRVRHGLAPDVSVTDSEVAAGVPPTVSITGASAVAEGASYTLNLSGSYTGDPDGDTITGWTIAWGDGAVQSVTGNPYQVTHVYTEGGLGYTITATASDDDGNYPVNSQVVMVALVPPTIVLSGASHVAAGSPYALTLGTISDAGGDDHVTQIIVHWGDGSTDSYATAGIETHIYTGTPSMPVLTVDLVDDEGTHLNAGNTIPLTVASAGVGLDVQIVTPIRVSEGVATGQIAVATFTDRGSSADSSTFSATIGWGDGTTTVGTIRANGMGAFDVLGSHTYAEEGSQASSVTVIRVGGMQTVGRGTIQVADAPLTAAQVTLNAVAGAPFAGVVATFSDANPAGVASEFTATIHWGDGTITAGTVTGSGGRFSVRGQHVYAWAGTLPITVVISDVGGSTAQTSGSAQVTLSGQSVGRHEAASIGFWHSTRGEALIRRFNGGAHATALSAWLARTFPKLYGALAGWTNGRVAAYFQTLYHRRGPRLEAELLATALNIYATTRSLGGLAAVHFGFAMSAGGLGTSTYDVGPSGAALRIADNQRYSVFALLAAADHLARGGVFDSGDPVSRHLVFSVFHGINTSWAAAIVAGQAASLTFWHRGHGQALLRRFDGGTDATALPAWLARTFPNLYGAGAGAADLTGQTNAQVGAYFQALYHRRGPRLEAELLTTALNIYATTRLLGDLTAVAFGFAVSGGGLGASTYDVGPDGAGMGMLDDQRYHVLAILVRAAHRARGGVLNESDPVGRFLAYGVFHGINTSGGIA
jgi:hypothetical protein